MSVFDPEKFMEQAPGAGSTNFEPIPAGEATALIDDAVVRAAGDGVVLDVTFLLQGGEGVNGKKIRTGIFLDVTPNGGMDWSKGKNVKLHRLRDAVGQNKTGWKYTDLRGAGPLKVQVSHRAAKDGSDQVFNDIKSFGKMK